MHPTPTKRPASNSPVGARPLKRALTSSPEEGEVDDGSFTVTNANPGNLPPRPVSPPRPPKSKVAFPFKRKAEIIGNGVGSEIRERASPMVYERSQEEELRIREGELKRKTIRDMPGDARRRGGPGGDHWEPGMRYGREQQPPMQRGLVHHGVDRYQPSYMPRDRDRLPPRDRRQDWHRDRLTPTGSNRGSHLRADRYHRTPSPPSPGRSRTPSPHVSQSREKHRLPAPRSPEPPLSPSRSQDRSWDRERPDREKRHYGGRNDHLASWNHDRDRDPPAYRRRGSVDEHDRYWRSDHPDSRNGQSTDDRGWPRDGFSDAGRSNKSGHEDEHRGDRDAQDSRPLDKSLPPPTAGPYSPRPPHSSLVQPCTPPPPPVSPPPPPPPLAEGQRDEILPANHAAISIQLPLSRPGAPKEIHSPPSLRLPVSEDIEGKGPKDGRKTPDISRDSGRSPQKVPDTGRPKPFVRKRKPVQRSSGEEFTAYGRSFKGCGKQHDYEVTTKLGEGTFGCVQAFLWSQITWVADCPSEKSTRLSRNPPRDLLPSNVSSCTTKRKACL